MGKPINIVFDGGPSHHSGRFVEVETDDGKSIKCGEWIKPDGNNRWKLRITELPDEVHFKYGDYFERYSDKCLVERQLKKRIAELEAEVSALSDTSMWKREFKKLREEVVALRDGLKVAKIDEIDSQHHAGIFQHKGQFNIVKHDTNGITSGIDDSIIRQSINLHNAAIDALLEGK